MQLTQQRLKDILSYNPDTGHFLWRVERNVRIRAGARAGTQHSKGYRQVSIDFRLYLEHRLAFLYMTGAWPEQWLDHRDGDRSNNAWANLRPCSPSENSQNTSTRASSSGIKGVYWCKTRSHWIARAKLGRQVVQGAFSTLDAATDAVKQYRAALHGEFANHG